LNGAYETGITAYLKDESRKVKDYTPTLSDGKSGTENGCFS
jgi:hypothetical protein